PVHEVHRRPDHREPQRVAAATGSPQQIPRPTPPHPRRHRGGHPGQGRRSDASPRPHRGEGATAGLEPRGRVTGRGGQSKLAPSRTPPPAPAATTSRPQRKKVDQSCRPATIHIVDDVTVRAVSAESSPRYARRPPLSARMLSHARLLHSRPTFRQPSPNESDSVPTQSVEA